MEKKTLIADHIRADVTPWVALHAKAAGNFKMRITGRVTSPDSVRLPFEALDALASKAFDLSTPFLDYEAAARAAGWIWDEGGPHFYRPNGLQKADYFACEPLGDERAADWIKLCDAEQIAPHETPIIGHYIVSAEYADKAEARGERVERDFGGVIVWARKSPSVIAELQHLNQTELLPLDRDPVLLAIIAEPYEDFERARLANAEGPRQ